VNDQRISSHVPASRGALLRVSTVKAVVVS
jgi:hypothetical protein